MLSLFKYFERFMYRHPKTAVFLERFFPYANHACCMGYNWIIPIWESKFNVC